MLRTGELSEQTVSVSVINGGSHKIPKMHLVLVSTS